jgi:hypothetical protein
LAWLDRGRISDEIQSISSICVVAPECGRLKLGSFPAHPLVPMSAPLLSWKERLHFTSINISISSNSNIRTKRVLESRSMAAASHIQAT